MPRKIGLAAVIAVLSLAFVSAAGAVPDQTKSINNGGGTPSCGNSCDSSHNPTDYEKPCAPVPGNGCHILPDTPCERGHGGTEIGNKHCGPGLTILKEQSSFPDQNFTHGLLTAPLNRDVFYRITVTNFTSTAYTLLATDLVCDDPLAHAIEPVGPQTLPAGGTVVYTCDIDAVPGAGGIPANAAPGGAPDLLVNTVVVVASPVGGGTSITLTDSVTASLN